jgi:hypothetical protein
MTLKNEKALEIIWNNSSGHCWIREAVGQTGRNASGGFVDESRDGKFDE